MKQDAFEDITFQKCFVFVQFTIIWVCESLERGYMFQHFAKIKCITARLVRSATLLIVLTRAMRKTSVRVLNAFNLIMLFVRTQKAKGQMVWPIQRIPTIRFRPKSTILSFCSCLIHTCTPSPKLQGHLV